MSDTTATEEKRSLSNFKRAGIVVSMVAVAAVLATAGVSSYGSMDLRGSAASDIDDYDRSSERDLEKKKNGGEGNEKKERGRESGISVKLKNKDGAQKTKKEDNMAGGFAESEPEFIYTTPTLPAPWVSCGNDGLSKANTCNECPFWYPYDGGLCAGDCITISNGQSAVCAPAPTVIQCTMEDAPQCNIQNCPMGIVDCDPYDYCQGECSAGQSCNAGQCTKTKEQEELQAQCNACKFIVENNNQVQYSYDY